MPNWCLNKLTVRGPELDVDAFRQKATGYSPWPRQREGEAKPNVLNCHSVVPIPSEILAGRYEDGGSEWERLNWGCTWGAYETEIIDEWEGLVVYEFQTAWSPPILFLEAAAKQWPILDVYARLR